MASTFADLATDPGRQRHGLWARRVVVLVSDGRVLETNLRRQRMTLEEVLAEARLQSIAGLEDIRFAVLETNGRVSFLTR